MKRRTVLGTLGIGALSAAALRGSLIRGNVSATEKAALSIGFLKQLDAAPIIVAKELGYFEDEGLSVNLEPQLSISALLQRLSSNQLDAAQAPIGLPLSARMKEANDAHLVVPLIFGVHGNSLNVSRAIWRSLQAVLDNSDHGAGPLRDAMALHRLARQMAPGGQRLSFGIASHLSSHSYELRYWLAAGGLRPGYFAASGELRPGGTDLDIWPLAPNSMVATLEAGTIHGFAAGEPWNQRAAAQGLGVPLVRSSQIRPNGAEKAFVLSEDFLKRNPGTSLGLVRALIRASIWLDSGGTENRLRAARLLSSPNYVGLNASDIARSFGGPLSATDAESARTIGARFFRDGAGYPYYSEAVWYLTQMRRWGQIPTRRTDAWYDGIARAVFRPDIYREAAGALMARKMATPGDFAWDQDSYQPADRRLAIDGMAFDARKPNAYVDGLNIGLHGEETVA